MKALAAAALFALLASPAHAGGWGFAIDTATAYRICQYPHIKNGPVGWQTIAHGPFEWCRHVSPSPGRLPALKDKSS